MGGAETETQFVLRLKTNINYLLTGNIRSGKFGDLGSCSLSSSQRIAAKSGPQVPY